MLAFANGEPFSTGRASFADHIIDEHEQTAKIYVRIEPYGLGAPVLAQLDTGAPWSVLNAEVAEELELLDGDGEPIQLSTRIGPVHGRLENVTITILADSGESLEVSARVFVSRHWAQATFLGYHGLLEKIRFALDPQANQFHFGGY